MSTSINTALARYAALYGTVTIKMRRYIPCPRCGNYSMGEQDTASREGVPVCPACGLDETLRASHGKPPFPLEDWALFADKIDLDNC